MTTKHIPWGIMIDTILNHHENVRIEDTGLDKPVFLSEYCTAVIGGPRQAGKSEYILSDFDPSTIVVVLNEGTRGHLIMRLENCRSQWERASDPPIDLRKNILLATDNLAEIVSKDAYYAGEWITRVYAYEYSFFGLKSRVELITPFVDHLHEDATFVLIN